MIQSQTAGDLSETQVVVVDDFLADLREKVRGK
jgi:hypothetical protein